MLPFINAPFAYVAGLLGASVDELKLIFSFLLSYPLAGILKRLPDNKPYQKNLFIIGVSLFYLVGLFDLWGGIRTILISSVAAYVISYYVSGPFMPWIGFVFLMGHMSVNHIARHIADDPSIIDITGAQMVLVMKLTAFCWNVHDGRLPEKDLSAEQKERAIKRLPELLDYAAFVLFFPSLMAGPAFDYVDYKRWIETSMFELPPGVDPAKAPRTHGKRKIPRSGTPATIKALIGLAWILAFLQFSGLFAADYLLSDEYVKHNIFRRIWILHMVGFTTRTKYYGVWSLTEGACILAGIGYKGVDPQTGRPNWDRLQNVNPLGLELAQNTRGYLASWNINTNNWLRNYMYLRVTPKGKKPGFRASMATFVTSAFWHGFEPGYYMAFVLASFLQTVAKNCRRYLRPFFLTPSGKAELPRKKYYDAMCWVVTQLAFSFTVAPFILLSLPASLTAWARVYFYCVIGVAVLLGVFSPPGKAFLKSKMVARTKKEEEAIERETLSRIGRTESSESIKSPSLGLPDDPGRDIDEFMEEVKKDLEERRSRGQSAREGLQEVMQTKMKEIQQMKDKIGVEPKKDL